MSFSKQHMARVVATFLLAAMADQAFAQSYSYGYGLGSSVLRLLMIAASTGAGFAMGWFFSPYGREFRRIVLVLLAGLIALIAVSDMSAIGWSLTIGISIVGFCVGFGYWMGRTLRKMLEVPTTFGSSKWADISHLEERGYLEEKGILLGEVMDGDTPRRVYYEGDRHAVTLAKTRGGKGISHIIPNLLRHMGSTVIIDPKGENALVTAKARIEMGQDVHLVDPFDIAASTLGMRPARFNPMEWIELSDIDAPENAMILADAIIKEQGEKEPFWTNEAKALLQGVILHVAFDREFEGRRNLGTVRDCLLGDGDTLIKLFQDMVKSPHALIASCGSRQLQKEEKLLSNVLATVQAATHFLDSARMREALSTSDFRFEDLKTEKISLYLILPADRLSTFSAFLRLMIEQSLTVNARNIELQPEQPVLYIIDEMPALGRLYMVEQAFGLMAGFGVQIWAIAQNVSQMKSIYGDGFETFIANAGVVSYFGSKDKASADYFSDLCGVTTVWNLSSAISTAISVTSGAQGSSSRSTSETDTRAASQRKLAYPDELMRLNETQQLLLIEDADPILARKLRWFEEPDMAERGVNLRTS